MAISNVPWFATTVEGRFGVGADGIFATIVRVVQAFVCNWVIIKVNIRSILPQQIGSQYSHKYNIIVYYIRVPKGFGAPSLRTQKRGAPGLRNKISRAPGPPRNWSRAPCSATLFCFNPKGNPRIEEIQQSLFFKRCFCKFFSTLLVFHSCLELFINHDEWMRLYKVQMPLVLRGSSTLSFNGFWYWERQCSVATNSRVWYCLCC